MDRWTATFEDNHFPCTVAQFRAQGKPDVAPQRGHPVREHDEDHHKKQELLRREGQRDVIAPSHEDAGSADDAGQLDHPKQFQGPHELGILQDFRGRRNRRVDHIEGDDAHQVEQEPGLQVPPAQEYGVPQHNVAALVRSLNFYLEEELQDHVGEEQHVNRTIEDHQAETGAVYVLQEHHLERRDDRNDRQPHCNRQVPEPHERALRADQTILRLQGLPDELNALVGRKVIPLLVRVLLHAEFLEDNVSRLKRLRQAAPSLQATEHGSHLRRLLGDRWRPGLLVCALFFSLLTNCFPRGRRGLNEMPGRRSGHHCLHDQLERLRV
mmetsp:Transcript_82754/g.192292  ORF Transcript_82754/g.192292 Transcript_82754/m.192292 type:complete len:325 (+) Transcript_82754:241-1215(+)